MRSLWQSENWPEKQFVNRWLLEKWRFNLFSCAIKLITFRCSNCQSKLFKDKKLKRKFLSRRDVSLSRKSERWLKWFFTSIMFACLVASGASINERTPFERSLVTRMKKQFAPCIGMNFRLWSNERLIKIKYSLALRKFRSSPQWSIVL